MPRQQNDLSLDNVAGYQKQAYWHVVAIVASLAYVIETTRMDPITVWAAQMIGRYSAGPLGPNQPEDVQDDQLLVLLEQTPRLILEVNRRLTWSKARELAPRVKMPTYRHDIAHEKRWRSAVEWARGIIARGGDVPADSIPDRDGVAAENRLVRLKKLSEGMGVDFVRRVADFIIQLNVFVELSHNTRQSRQSVELEEPLVNWATRWSNYTWMVDHHCRGQTWVD